MTTRSGARAAAVAIPPLPLPPPRRSQHAFLDGSPLIESIAATAPLPDADSSRRQSRRVIEVGDGGDDGNSSSHGVVAGAWLSADNSRGIAWELEPEVWRERRLISISAGRVKKSEGKSETESSRLME